MKTFVILLILAVVSIISGCGDGGSGSSSGSFSHSVTLMWDAPTTNIDESQLNDLGGYKIYYGTSSGNYETSIDIGNVTTYTINNLPSGTYYLVVTAYDTSSNESSYSNEVSKTIQ